MRILIYGGTGQAKVVRPILLADRHQICAVFDRNRDVAAPFDCKLFHDDVASAASECDGFIVCIGGTHGAERVRISESLLALGMIAVGAVHATAHVARSATLGLGVQVMARAVVSEEARVGDYCILNTNCTIDHECQIGQGAHIMGGVSLAGLVRVGDFASIGTNATVLPRVTIGANAIVGAGAVVVRDVPDGVTVVGVPARCMSMR